jgi:hypothetical protein
LGQQSFGYHTFWLKDILPIDTLTKDFGPTIIWLANILADRHFADRYLDKRLFADRHFDKRHLASTHFAD